MPCGPCGPRGPSGPRRPCCGTGDGANAAVGDCSAPKPSATASAMTGATSSARRPQPVVCETECDMDRVPPETSGARHPSSRTHECRGLFQDPRAVEGYPGDRSRPRTGVDEHSGAHLAPKSLEGRFVRARISPRQCLRQTPGRRRVALTRAGADRKEPRPWHRRTGRVPGDARMLDPRPAARRCSPLASPPSQRRESLGPRRLR